MNLEQKLQEKLAQRQSVDALRQLSVPSSDMIDFCSNDYLGLARNPELYQAIEKRYANLHLIQNGSGGSRLIAGNYLFYNQLEGKLSLLFRAKNVLIFNSGYAANTAILSAVPQRGDTIIYDEYIHASLKEGARLSFAQRFSFRHNDLNDLEKKLQVATGQPFVVAEAVYSMDGDMAPLRKILSLCKKYQAALIWDEAHSTGIWGKGGNGIACETEQQDEIFARIYTFGKGPGVHGACIAGSDVLIQYLINFARPFIYTTALPLHSLVSIEQSFEYTIRNPWLQKDIHTRIQFFRKQLAEYPVLQKHFIDSQSPIQAIQIGGNAQTKAIARQLQQHGFDIRPILSPTIKEGEERLRICLHVFNTEEQIHVLIQKLNYYMESLS